MEELLQLETKNGSDAGVLRVRLGFSQDALLSSLIENDRTFYEFPIRGPAISPQTIRRQLSGRLETPRDVEFDHEDSIDDQNWDDKFFKETKLNGSPCATLKCTIHQISGLLDGEIVSIFHLSNICLILIYASSNACLVCSLSCCFRGYICQSSTR